MTDLAIQQRRELQEQIKILLEAKDTTTLQLVLADTRSADVAEIVETLPEDQRQILLELLEPEEAGQVLEKIDEVTRNEVMEVLDSNTLSRIVATLPPDEAADVIAEVDQETTEKILRHIDEEESADIARLLTYDEESAGGIMTTELIQAPYSGTIRDAIHALRQSDPEGDFYVVFIVDQDGTYKGVITTQALLRHRRSTPVADVLDADVPAVDITADQEQIAQTFRKNDLIVAPVVGPNNVLMGRITADDIVDVMEEEAEEDALVMAGTRPEELETRRPLQAAAVRLPWLLTCMIGALFSTLVFYPLFQPWFQVADFIVLLMFVPAIAAMGGNSGMQTSTVVVRGLATGDLVALQFAQVFLRELRVASIVALACGLLAGAVAFVWLSYLPLGDQSVHAEPTATHLSDETVTEPFNRAKAPVMALAVATAMFTAILLSTLLGLCLPFLFRRIGIDPAISSGPLVTTTNDIVSFVTYFALGLLFLKFFGHS